MPEFPRRERQSTPPPDSSGSDARLRKRGVTPETDAMVDAMFADQQGEPESAAESSARIAVARGGRTESGVTRMDMGSTAATHDTYVTALAAPLGDWAKPYIGKIPEFALRRLNVPEADGGYSPDVREEMLSGWESGAFSFSSEDQQRAEDRVITRDLATRIRDFDTEQTRTGKTKALDTGKTRTFNEGTRVMEDAKTRVMAKKQKAAIDAPPLPPLLDPSFVTEIEDSPVVAKKPARKIPEVPNLKTLSREAPRTSSSLPPIPEAARKKPFALPAIPEAARKKPFSLPPIPEAARNRPPRKAVAEVAAKAPRVTAALKPPVAAEAPPVSKILGGLFTRPSWWPFGKK